MRLTRLPTVLFLLLFLVFPAAGDETISLSDYLRRANQSGLRIIFSSSLVLPRFLVTLNDGNAITSVQVGKVLASFELLLKQVGGDNYVVQRLDENPGSIRVEVDPEPFAARPLLEEIVVTSSQYKLLMGMTSNVTTLGHEDLARRPAIANDALRTINHLPGTASVGISVRPRVRGGNEDETLINFNGVRLYEPFHLKEFNGLFSTVDNRVVNSLEFMSGGFPVKYGDRLSAVMQINTETPEDLGKVRELGIGLYTASYLHSGGSADQHYLIDARRSTVEGLASLAETDFGTPSFADVFATYTWMLDGDRTLSANLLWYGDDVAINNGSGTETAKSINGNTYLWLDFLTDLSDHFTSRSIVSFAALKNDREGRVNKPGQVAGALVDDQEFRIYSLNQLFTFYFNDNQSQDHENAHRGMLDLGFEYRYLDAEYDFESELQIDPVFSSLSNYPRPVNQKFVVKEVGQHIGLYANYKWRPLRNFYTETGIRIDWQDYISGWTQQISPRINLLYLPNEATQLRLSWGKFAQAEGIHELKISDGLVDFQRPQKATHQIASITHVFNSGLRVRVEAYRKHGIDNGQYFENLTNSVTLLPELQVDRFLVKPDDFTAKGVEISVDGYTPKFDWWLNYTFSSAKDRVNSVNVRRSWDQENGANLGVSTHWGSWQHTVTATYHTGWSTTPLSLQDDGRVTALRRNTVRFSTYLSIDFKAMKTWQFVKGRSLRIEAGLTNLFNRENQIGTEYKLRNGRLVNSGEFALSIAPFFDLYCRF